LDSWQLLFSLGGGTGSGMGCLLAERLVDEYPKKSVVPVCTLPDWSKVGEHPVKIHPVLAYNIMLTTAHLDGLASASIMIDDVALESIPTVGECRELPDGTLSAEALAGVTCSLRCAVQPPIAAATSFSHLVADMTPMPQLRILTLGIGSETQLEWLQRPHVGSASGHCLSALAVHPPGMYTNWSDMTPRAFFSARVTCSSALPSGAAISNHTSISNTLSLVASSAGEMLNSRRFMNWYTGEGMEEDELHRAHQVLLDIAARYNEAASPSVGSEVEVMRESQ